MSEKLRQMALPHCPSCKTSSRKKKYQLKESVLYECLDCRLRYLDPCLDPASMKKAYESDQSLAALHNFHEGYYDYGDLQTPSRTLSDFKRGLGILEDLRPQKGTVLDVGFGNGLFLAAARERGWDVRGIDSSLVNGQTAKRKFGLDLELSGFEDYDPCETFDVISFWDVIEHLPDPGTALQKASRLLKPGGLVLIAVPNDYSLLAQLAGFFYRLGIQRTVNKIYFLEHVTYYGPNTLRKLLETNGFFLRNQFTTSTDLAKYALPKKDKLIAGAVLFTGKHLGLQNRLVAVFQKKNL